MEGWDKPITDWVDEVKEYTASEVVRLSKEALTRIQARTPVESGTLQAGWVLEQMLVDGTVDVVIRNKVEYVIFVEYGTDQVVGRYMLEQTLNELIEGTI